jgi:DNA-binding response OmpR family regulator
MKTILVVEDDARIAAALGVRLRAAGYQVLTAADGRTGLTSAVTAKPDLIITDIWMPDPIGFLSRERLHNLGLTGVPIIYITASKKKDLRKTAEEEGAAGFFEKPYDPQKLLAAVAEALSKCAGAERPHEPARQ